MELELDLLGLADGGAAGRGFDFNGCVFDLIRICPYRLVIVHVNGACNGRKSSLQISNNVIYNLVRNCLRIYTHCMTAICI